MAKAEQPVDLQHLDRFTGGERAINEEILLLFDNQCREILAKLDGLACAGGDAKSWHEMIHTLKGAARGVGAFALGDAAAEAEKAGESGAAIAALEQLKNNCAAVQVFIEKFLKNGV